MDLTFDCANELDMSQFPCIATDYGYPQKLLLMHPNGTLTVSGETPTLAEIQTGIAASGDNKLIVIEQFTNGQRIEADRAEESGADTADGLTDVVSINMAITGKIKRLNEYVRKHLAELNGFRRAKCWVITNKGYVFGGSEGYKVSLFFPPTLLEGFGVAANVPFRLVYAHNLNATDPAGQDDGFLTVENTATT